MSVAPGLIKPDAGCGTKGCSRFLHLETMYFRMASLEPANLELYEENHRISSVASGGWCLY